MKHLLLILTAVLLSSGSFAQLHTQTQPHTLKVYSESGETFNLYVDGNAINSTAAASVNTELTANTVLVRIVFSNSELGEFTQRNVQVGPLKTGSTKRTTSIYKIQSVRGGFALVKE